MGAAAVSPLAYPYPPGHLFGLGMANNSTTAIDVAAGKCRDSTDTVNMVFGGLTNKILGTAWAAGASAGMLDGGSVANASYHLHAIKKDADASCDIVASLSSDAKAVVTITVASPAVVSWTNHGLVAGSPVKFSTTGALPTGLTPGTQYYVISAGLSASAFEVSTSIGGSAVNTTGTQSGVHTGLAGPALPAGYTYFRRVGSIVRSGAAILAFKQDGDEFQWLAPVGDISSTNPGVSAVTRTLTLPVGIRVLARLGVLYTAGSDASASGGHLLVSDLSATDTAASNLATSVSCYTTTATELDVAAPVSVFSSPSAQVRSRNSQSNANTIVHINTHGWNDTRGRAA